MEYAILQCESLAKEAAVFFLCKSSFPKDRFSPAVKIIEFAPVDAPFWALGRLKTIWRMTIGLNRYSRQISHIAELGEFDCILFSFYKEYFAPFWVGPLRSLVKKGVVIGTIAHDPVRDFVIGPEFWHRFCVRKAFSFLTHVFVHDQTPVDFGGHQPEGIQVHQIPHGPYEVAEPKIGRLEMRKRMGFSSDLTTEDTTERLGGREMEQPKVGPKGVGLCTTESKSTGVEAGPCLDKPSCASESDSLTSKLADSPVSESPTRFASAPPSSPATSHTPRVTAPRALYLDSRPSTLDTFAPADFVFLAFGQIRDGKNLDLFLRAMTHLPKHVKLLVAGKGDSGSSRPPEFYQNLAEELGVADRCRWDIRQIPDGEVGDIFAVSDVALLAYSAKFRSASGVLNAAVSARKPVLASSGPGPLKTVVEKYHLGVFVEPDDLKEILRGAQMLLYAHLSPVTQNLDTCFSPAWVRYENENSWSLNAQLVAESFFVKK